MVREVLNDLQNPRIKTLTAMLSAQTGKTTMLMIYQAWRIKERPARGFWVLDSEEKVNEFSWDRLMPFLELQDCLLDYLPQNRTERTKALVQFRTMSLHFRGANSRGKLQSTPIGYYVGDEVDRWPAGRAESLNKRIRTYMRGCGILIGSPENENSVTHQEFMKGTQSIYTWPCPACQHEQPFRFGHKADSIFTQARTKGGFIWDQNEITRPAGRWNWAELRKTVRYECESCGHQFTQEKQFELLQRIKRLDLNPTPEPNCYSHHWWSAYSVWVKWDDIVCEFIASMDQWERGNPEPLQVFVKETLGLPWLVPSDTQADELMVRQRIENYRSRELWPVEKDKEDKPIANLFLVLTADVQLDYLRYVIRQWRRGTGESRLIEEGQAKTFEALREIVVRWAIKGNCVWVDSGHRAAEVYRACHVNRWKAMKGSDRAGWESIFEKRKVTRHWHFSTIDPERGAKAAGPLPFYLWSNPFYKSVLYQFKLHGKGAQWSLPLDVSDLYIEELLDERLIREKSGEFRYHDTGNNHAGDCELMQLVAADVLGFGGKQ